MFASRRLEAAAPNISPGGWGCQLSAVWAPHPSQTPPAMRRAAFVRPCRRTAWRVALRTSDYGTFFFLISTLLPMMPPRIPPAAAPMMPPFTLFPLVVAPMTAPATAPMAASRLVFFSVTVRGSEATLPPDDEVARRRAVVVRAGVVEPVRCAVAAAAA